MEEHTSLSRVDIVGMFYVNIGSDCRLNNKVYAQIVSPMILQMYLDLLEGMVEVIVIYNN